MDFEETFSPIARYETLRMLLALSANRKWPIYQLDVEADLLTAKMEEEVYMSPPEGFSTAGMVCKLNKAIYGLKQAPRGWYGRLASFFERNGFQKSEIQPTLYVKKDGGKDNSNSYSYSNPSLLIVCVYGDDLIYMGSSPYVTTEFKDSMIDRFEMSDLGKMHSFLELDIKQCEDGVFISQSKFAERLVDRFNVTNQRNAAITPMNVDEDLERDDDNEKVDARSFKVLVYGLIHLTHTRPDISYAVGVISRFMDDPRMKHFRAAKRILSYIAGTREFGIWYSVVDEFKLIGFTDSVWGGYDDRKSISGSVFSLGSGVITWSSNKQGVAALSTSEAEYMAVTASSCQAMWLRRLLADLDQKQEEATEIFCDIVAFRKNPFVNGRTEHIDNQFQLIRYLVGDGFVSLKFCNSAEQVAEIFTKALPSTKHIKFRNRLGVCKYESRGECRLLWN